MLKLMKFYFDIPAFFVRNRKVVLFIKRLHLFLLDNDFFYFRRAKTRRGKRFLENRQPKVIENDKTAIIVKGGKTSQTVTDALADLYALKKPLAMRMKRFTLIIIILLFEVYNATSHSERDLLDKYEFPS